MLRSKVNILEMGNDFAFLDRQKIITIDKRDYYFIIES